MRRCSGAPSASRTNDADPPVPSRGGHATGGAAAVGLRTSPPPARVVGWLVTHPSATRSARRAPLSKHGGGRGRPRGGGGPACPRSPREALCPRPGERLPIAGGPARGRPAFFTKARRMFLSHASAVGLSVPDADDITAWIRSPDYPSYESRAESGTATDSSSKSCNGSVVTTASASPMPRSAWPRRHASEGGGMAEGALPGACGSIHVLVIGLHCPEESPGDPPCEYHQP